MSIIAENKAIMRERAKAVRDALPEAYRLEASLELAAKAESAGLQRHLPLPGGIVAGYMPIQSEIDPRPLMAALEASGYCLALPHIDDGVLTFRAYRSGDKLDKGRFGTLQPGADRPIVTPGAILTPLLAFDIRGTRLGYGKGFYDRAFGAAPEAKRIGLAYAAQQVVAVPCEPHDIELDVIFTER